MKVLAFALIPVMTLMGSVASIFFKRATGADGLKALLTCPPLYIGGFLYVASAVVNIFVLKFLNYSVVLPLTSLTYIWTLVLARITLGERLTGRKIAGVTCVFAGAVLLALGM